MNLAGRVALVTGAAHRVGQAIALELAAAGARLVVHHHRTPPDATLAECAARGASALAVAADLGRPDQIDALFKTIAAECGRLDVLVNSAGIMAAGPALDLPLTDWQRSLDLNLTAPFLCAQQAARLMLAREEPAGAGPAAEAGVIVNITDGSSLRPWARYPAHTVSKAGLAALTGLLAKALAPRVRVNAVCPGPVEKPPDLDPAAWARLAGHSLLKRPGSGYDVARAVRFLIENDYITGETLVVDGGDRYR